MHTRVDEYHADFPVPAAKPNLNQYKEWLVRQMRDSPAVLASLEFAQSIRQQGLFVCYIGGALTNASDSDKERYECVAQIVSQECPKLFGYAPHINGTDPKAHPRVSTTEVRDIDYLWAVVMADFHIHFLDPVAHGNGIEMAWAESAHIPIILCAPHNLHVSRLPRGLSNVVCQIQYWDTEEIYHRITQMAQDLSVWLSQKSDQGITHFFLQEYQ